MSPHNSREPAMARPNKQQPVPLCGALLLVLLLLVWTPSSSARKSPSAIASSGTRSRRQAACCFLGRPPLLLFTGPHQDHGAASTPSAVPSVAAGRPRPLLAAAAATSPAAGEGAGSAPLLLSEGRTAGGGHTHPDDQGRTIYRADPATGGLLQHKGTSVPGSNAPSAAGLATSDQQPVAPARAPRRASFPALASSVRWVKRLLRSVFLPVGWPGSVAPEYLRFQAFNIIQDLSTYLRGILATKAILEGVGVGREGATPLAATIQWITRDGASMMSGLLFTSLLSQSFGTNAKSWRLFGDFIVDVGITLDMLAPLFPKHFLHLICLASVCKSLCGIAAGSANGAIVEHFSRNNNIAEVLAKGGAQHTAVSLAGLAFSFSFARYANASPKRIWTAYIALTAIHLLANYAAMSTLAFRSLNRRRLAVVLHAFCGHDNHDSSVPTPAQAARKETIVPSPIPLPGSLAEASRFLGKRLRLGVRVKELADNAAELARLQQRLVGEAYLLNATPKGTVVVALREDSTHLTALKACLHAYLYHERSKALKGPEAATTEGRLGLVEATHMEACKLFPDLEQALRAQGWDLDKVLLSPQGWTYRWG